MPRPRPLLRLDSIDEHPEYSLNLGAESPASNLSFDDRIPTPPPRVFSRRRLSSSRAQGKREGVDRDCGIWSVILSSQHLILLTSTLSVLNMPSSPHARYVVERSSAWSISQMCVYLSLSLLFALLLMGGPVVTWPILRWSVSLLQCTLLYNQYPLPCLPHSDI